ncbi:MAG: hypothetical protein E6G01_18025 [Actinobacteria bacterium]|nr:MAG: hypothetical protein E6G01_18025 [Actinomycetota bacterium]
MTPGPSPRRRGSGARRAVLAILARPRLWRTALVQVALLARPGWWRRWPPVPRPDEGYLRFRLETAYGDPEAEMAAGDVVEYLAWCREARLAAR